MPTSFLRLVSAALLLSTAVPAYAATACTMDAKLCPDGKTYVGRDGSNNCEWQKCPGEAWENCTPYVCSNGKTHPRCTDDGVIIHYIAEPCHMDGGESASCSALDCGEPRMGMPNWQCPDDSTGGPACARTDDGSCGWVVRDCPNDSKFSDVPTDHPNSDAIFYVRSAGIVQGYADGTFKPDATINRAEFVKILVGAATAEDGPMCKIAPFTDVDQTAWYAASAHTARCHGIVEGHPDGSFKPANPINFAEAAKILAKAFQLDLVTTVPVCETSECPWYRDYVLMLEAKDAIPTSILSFDQNITRGDMAEMIYRLRMGGDKPSRTYDFLQWMVMCRMRKATGDATCE